jgi:mono/diheme cytochrome c family protein
LNSTWLSRFGAVAICAAGLGVSGSTGAADSTAEPKPAQAVTSSNPLSGNPEAVEAGGKLFHTWCAQCHGSTAGGSKYGANLTIFSKGYKEFLATVTNGRVQKMMPPWKDVLDQDSINRIGAYLETLAQPGAYWK